MRRILCLILSTLLLVSEPIGATAVPYKGYNYYSQEKYAPAPAAYVPDRYVTGTDMGAGPLKDPTDLFVADNGLLYVLDSGNNRILILNTDFNLVEVIASGRRGSVEEPFNMPSGISMSRQGVLYVADTGNNRVIGLDSAGNIVYELCDVQSETFTDDFVFLPMKIAIDPAGSLYVIAKNVFQGIMVFDNTCRFVGYVGTIHVKVSPIDLFWRKFATKAQRAKMPLFIPTEFSNLDIDAEGFVFATNVDKGSDRLILKLNPQGNNVLRNYDEYTLPVGDMLVKADGPFQGQSRFSSIKIREKGIYSVVDDLRGRIFTYDNEGHLLYIFGGIGTQIGTLEVPTAIEEFCGELIVLDKNRGSITAYTPTNYGDLINKAVGMHFDGDDDEAYKVWETIANIDANNELAYIGIGKAQLARGDNLLAMRNFRRARSKLYYSIAFKRYRNELFQKYSPYALTVLTIILLCFILIKIYRKLRRREVYKNG